MADTALRPIRRNTSLTREVIDRLSKAILSGELAQGSSLPEAQTATKLGVSRVPVREALVELERQGLVDFDENGRAAVRAFTKEDVQEILSLRCALQRMAAGLAASKMTDADLERLEAILSKAGKTKDLTEFSRLDSAFHDEVVVIARHSRLQRMWNDVRAQMELWLARLHQRREHSQHDVREATLSSHRKMIDTLAMRKPDVAADLMERHCGWSDYPV
jgi:DNA-binding GntR family transcriptional regulator